MGDFFAALGMGLLVIVWVVLLAISLPFWIPAFLICLVIGAPFIPFILCLDENNSPLTSSALENINLKLNKFEATHGKKLEVNEEKLTNMASLIQKLQPKNESKDQTSKAERKEIEKELLCEMKGLDKEFKSQFTRSEYKEFKKEIMPEIKVLKADLKAHIKSHSSKHDIKSIIKELKLEGPSKLSLFKTKEKSIKLPEKLVLKPISFSKH